MLPDVERIAKRYLRHPAVIKIGDESSGKNKRIELKESDWKVYTGSSNELNADIEKYGKDKFRFTILHFCGSKWELGYREIKEQIHRDVILSQDYYNGILNVRIGTPPKDFKI
jgi:hypothetical protein